MQEIEKILNVMTNSVSVPVRGMADASNSPNLTEEEHGLSFRPREGNG